MYPERFVPQKVRYADHRCRSPPPATYRESYSTRNKLDSTGSGYQQFPEQSGYTFAKKESPTCSDDFAELWADAHAIMFPDGCLSDKKYDDRWSSELDPRPFQRLLEVWKQEGCPALTDHSLYNDDFAEISANNPYGRIFADVDYSKIPRYRGLLWPRKVDSSGNGFQHPPELWKQQQRFTSPQNDSSLYNDDYAKTEADPCGKQREDLCSSTRQGDFRSKRTFFDRYKSYVSFKEEQLRREKAGLTTESSTTWQIGVPKSASTSTWESSDRNERTCGRLTTEKVDHCLSTPQAGFCSKKNKFNGRLLPTFLKRKKAKR